MKNTQTNEIKAIKKYNKVFPIILVNKKLGLLRIVNRNSTTSFTLNKHETKAEIDKELKQNGMDEWTPHNEVEMAIGSGFHRVPDSENKEHWDLWFN